MTLEKKNAFVTGGAQGLGKAYVQRFMEEGANACFGDIDADTGKATEQELQEKHGKDRVMFIQFDVTDAGSFKDAFEKAVSHFGNMDVFVNNAGILNEAVWEKMIGINFIGTVRDTNLAMDHMRKDKGGKGGRIINISSIIGLAMNDSTPVYSGTKHAVRSFSTCIAMTPGLETEMGIEVAIICPDLSNADLMTKLDETRLLGYSKIKDHMNARMMPVSTATDGLFSLLTREDYINGAILLVTLQGSSFQRVDRVDLGTQWLIPNPKI